MRARSTFSFHWAWIGAISLGLLACSGRSSSSNARQSEQTSQAPSSLARGRIVKSGSRLRSTAVNYDEMGRIRRAEHKLEGQTYAYETEFGYAGGPRELSELGSVTTALLLPGGEKILTEFDAAGAVARTRSVLEGKYSDVVQDVSRLNTFGAVESSDYGNHTRTYRSYNGVRRLENVVTVRRTEGFEEVILAFGYEYDTLGRIRHMRDYCSVEAGTCCDPRDSSCQEGPMSASYDYDASGSLSSMTRHGQVTRYHSNAIHNLVQKEGVTHGFDSADHPHALTWTRKLDGQLSAQYEYDRVGQMVSMRENGVETQFSWNAAGMPRLSQRGDFKTERFYLGEGLFKRREVKGTEESVTLYLPFLRISNGVVTHTYGSLAEREVTSDSTTLRFFHVNAGGSVSVATDSHGQVIHRSVYNPFGEKLSQAGPFTPNPSFSFKELESGTGLLDFGARLYNPHSGQFISPDAIMDGLNAYAYVGNDPINRVDPTGHQSEEAKRICDNPANICDSMTVLAKAPRPWYKRVFVDPLKSLFTGRAGDGSPQNAENGSGRTSQEQYWTNWASGAKGVFKSFANNISPGMKLAGCAELIGGCSADALNQVPFPNMSRDERHYSVPFELTLSLVGPAAVDTAALWGQHGWRAWGYYRATRYFKAAQATSCDHRECWYRADVWTQAIEDKFGVTPQRAFLIASDENPIFYRTPDGRFIAWQYHTAPSVRKGGIDWIIEPKFFRRPVSSIEWQKEFANWRLETEMNTFAIKPDGTYFISRRPGMTPHFDHLPNMRSEVMEFERNVR